MAAVKTRVDDRTGLTLVYIQGGEFLMGSDEAGDEKPIHRVRLSPFWMSRYTVTNADFGRYLEDTPKQKPARYWTDSDFNQPNQPVVGVSWEDVQRYCQWAGMALTTEAQWEYACRAGSARVVRGGGWELPAGNARSAYRDGLHPKLQWGSLGFRVVCAAAPIPHF